jgi:cephalosporin hydroxylase
MSSSFREFIKTVRAPVDRRTALRSLREFHSAERSIEEAVDQALHFGSKRHYKVKTRQIRSEIVSLMRTVAGIKPGVILEIGTSACGTLFLWAQLASESAISCDLRIRSGLKELAPTFPPPASKCEVKLMIGDSHSPEFVGRVREALGNRTVDFLFIDGDHTEAGVEADFKDYGPLVRPGGFIGFHDIVESQPRSTTRVHYFWQRIKDLAEHQEFIADPDQCGFGIGVIRVPEDPDSLFRGL